jgi:hypothetical protein
METENVEKNWLNVKQAILEATKESLGYKPIKKKTWIRTWNEEPKLKFIIKKHKYKVYLHNKNPQHIKYKKNRAEVSKLYRRTWGGGGGG